MVVLGGGSNVVVADRGLDAMVLRVAIRGHRHEGGLHRCGAGEPWDDVVAQAVGVGDAGIECLSGIPGEVGAAPMQNIGAYGQEVASTIVAVEAIRRADGIAVELDNAACGFGYRDSMFKREGAGKYIVTAVSFQLATGGAATVAYPELARAAREDRDLPRPRDSVPRLRRNKSMVLTADDENRRPAGPFYVNPTVTADEADSVAARAAAITDDPMPRYPSPHGVKLSAAWLIDRSGLHKGFSRGQVGLSTRHTLAIVNRGGASAKDIVQFAAEVRDTVRATFAVTLTPGPTLLGFSDDELAPLRRCAVGYFLADAFLADTFLAAFLGLAAATGVDAAWAAGAVR